MKIYDNNHGGSSYILTRGDSLDELPISVKKFLNRFQTEVFFDPAKSLKKLTEDTTIRSMKEWLLSLRSSQCRLEIHMTKYIASAVYLRFEVEDNWTPGIGFNYVNESDFTFLKYPDVIQEVYSILGTVNLHGHGFAGGLHFPDTHPNIQNRVEIKELCNIDFDGYVSFYQKFAEGKLLLFKNEKTTWYCPDNYGETKEDDDLKYLLDRIFESFINRKEY
jgi:hypothetical protein